MDIFLTVLALLPFYLIGCYPTGYLLARRRGIDLTREGSGNVGATNVARIMGLRIGALTLLIDILKGFFSVWLAWWLSANQVFAASAGFATVAGHCFSIPTKLPGGKGVATALGVSAALSPYAAGLGCAVFAATFAITKIVSLSSVAAVIAAPLLQFMLPGHAATTYCLAGIGLLVVARHRHNLIRLAHGTERSFGPSQSPPRVHQD